MANTARRHAQVLEHNRQRAWAKLPPQLRAARIAHMQLRRNMMKSKRRAAIHPMVALSCTCGLFALAAAACEEERSPEASADATCSGGDSEEDDGEPF